MSKTKTLIDQGAEIRHGHDGMDDSFVPTIAVVEVPANAEDEAYNELAEQSALSDSHRLMAQMGRADL
jgi:hypothetical protein